MKFANGQPVLIRLASAAATALNAPGDIPLVGATMEDGWILADYKNPDGSVTRYALPPDSVLYVKQDLSAEQLSTSLVPPVRV